MTIYERKNCVIATCGPINDVNEEVKLIIGKPNVLSSKIIRIENMRRSEC